MMWDGSFDTQSDIASHAIDALFHRIVVDPPRGWFSKPWFKRRYPHRVTVDGRTHSARFGDITFENFRPEHKWWVQRGYSTLHFYFRTENDAMLFRLTVL